MGAGAAETSVRQEIVHGLPDRRVPTPAGQALPPEAIGADLGFTVPRREVRPDGSAVATIHLYPGEETL